MKTERIGPVTRTRLNNGLTVVLSENHAAPVAAFQVWVDVGSADESSGEEGMAHLHEHMLFKGTAQRGVGAIAQAIEGAGGEINAWTSFDHTVYHVVLPSAQLDLGIEVLADAVRNAAFDPVELEREKKVVLEEIRRTRDAPGRWIGDLVFATAYRKHPYAHPILGNAQTVGRVTREAILRFFRRHYVSGRMTVVAVGDFALDATLSKIQRSFGGRWSASAKKRPDRPPETPQRKLRVRLQRDNIQEAHFILGFHIPGLVRSPGVLEPDISALDVLALILGQGESSRLTLSLKRGANLVNDIYSYVYSPRDPGLFIIGGSCPAEKLVPALRRLSDELSSLTRKPVENSDIAKAKRMIESDLLYQQETFEGLARKFGHHQLLMGDPTFAEAYLSRIQLVTREDVSGVARRHLGDQNASLVVLLPDAQARDVDEAALRTAIEQGHGSGSADSAGSEGAPVPGKAEKKVSRFKIQNGPTVLIEEDHTNALVSLRAVYLGGVRYEDGSSNGINNFLAGMVTRGTTGRTAEEIGRETDEIAGNIEGFSGRNIFGLRADFPSRYQDRGLSLFFDCLQHPSFPETEIKRERELVLEAIRSREDNLSGMAFDLFAAALYPTHPYRMPILGTRRTVATFRRQTLKAYLARHFTPDRLVLSVVGDVDTQSLLAQIKRLLGPPSPKGKISPPTIPLDPKPSKNRHATKIRSREQAHLVLGFMGTTLASPDRYPLDVLMAILAGQGGRLFVELRDRRSLAYAISGFSLEGIEPGYLAFYLGTDPKRLDEAVAAVKEQLGTFCTGPIDPAEVKRAQQYLVGTHQISLQRTSTRAAALALNEIYGLGHLAHEEYPQRILAVTPEDVLRIAQRYVDLDASCLAVVKPGAKPR